MAQFTVEIPDDLLPAIEAEYLAVSTGGGTSAATAAEYFEASCVESVRQRAEIYEVGSYYKGAVTIEPRFLADGRGNPAYTGPDAVPYVVIYPADNEGVDWVSGDQWTDPVTGTVYEFTDGVWAEPAPVVDGDAA
jgi:hypothetical protein